MDKYEFMCMVQDILAESKTEEDIEKRAKEMMEVIQYQMIMSKGHLRCGIL